MSIKSDLYRTIDPVLTTLTQGYTNSNMVANALFPTIELPVTKGKIPIFNKNAFITRETFRATGALSNRIAQSDYELIPFECTERDIEMAIDYLEEEQNDTFFKLEKKVTKDLSDILQLGKEQQAADFAQNADNYSAVAKLNIAANNFLDPNTNPLDIIKSAIASVRSRIGRTPNTAVMGAAVYSALLDHPLIIDRVKFSGVRRVNLQVLSELFEIPFIKVGYAQIANDSDGFSDIWKDNIILAAVDENEKHKRNEFNPSYGYTLQRKGNPEIDTYYENGGKIKIIRCTNNYTIKVTCPDAAFLIYNCLTNE